MTIHVGAVTRTLIGAGLGATLCALGAQAQVQPPADPFAALHFRAIGPVGAPT